MATLQASILLPSSVSSSSSASRRAVLKANLSTPNLLQTPHISVPYQPMNQFVDDMDIQKGFQTLKKAPTQNHETMHRNNKNGRVIEELYSIMDAVADRAEMHKNIGAQRDNWNSLLLTSINGMTTSAATMAGLAAMSGGGGAALLGLKLSSTLLYVAATGFLMVMNKIQPSQLAEEQRNATRLFKQLHQHLKTTIAIGNHCSMEVVEDAMERVLALDRAYPLPLLGAMLDKFPKNVEPTVWWPKHYLESRQQDDDGKRTGINGWSERLEDEMKEVVSVLKRKDEAEYVRLSKMALKVNKVLSICGPVFTGIAAVGSGCPWSWSGILGVTFGALATVVNTIEHGGQVGMVFEMYRSSAGFFRLMEETIESTLKEREVDGQLFEAEVALKLGRSLSELRHLATPSSSSESSPSSPTITEATEVFASKLF